MIIKDRAPYIKKVGTSRPIRDPLAAEDRAASSSFKPQSVKHCSICGARMVYVSTMRCFYCNVCSNVMDPEPSEMQRAIEHENQSTAPIFGTADGSRIFNFSSSGGSYDSMFGRRGGRSSPGGVTIPIRNNAAAPNAIVDKLRMKDGRTKEMDQIFRQQDEQLTSRGRTITGDRVELKRSSNILSSDELRAEREGTAGLTGAGKYNPATGSRRTRLSF